jgi:hypothetical protein
MNKTGFHGYFFEGFAVQQVVQLLVLFSFTLTSVFGNAALESSFEWEPKTRPAIRSLVQTCATLLSPAEPDVNDSVGVLLGGNTLPEFQAALDKLISERGEASVLGGKIFVTGVGMGEEAGIKTAFENELLKRNLLRDGTSVTVLSYPKRDVLAALKEASTAVLQRVRYFFPSIAAHYQAPLRGEVVSGALTTLAIEAPNVVFLYKTLPSMDAHLTVVTHSIVLALYVIYQKFMLNWLLAPGRNRVEQFLQNALLSFPFVANYSVFGNFSKILGHYRDHGWDQTLAQFPHELANFATTQGLTLFLQVVFYSVVITNGIGGWQNSVKGEEESRLARTVGNIIKSPILALDAVILALASANSHVFFSMGPFDVNSGHLALAGITASGALLYLKPGLLDPSLKAYTGTVFFFKRLLGPASDWFKKISARFRNPKQDSSGKEGQSK